MLGAYIRGVVNAQAHRCEGDAPPTPGSCFWGFYGPRNGEHLTLTITSFARPAYRPQCDVLYDAEPGGQSRASERAVPNERIQGPAEDGAKVFCRALDTPKGSLTARVRQTNDWPTEGRFPLFDDWLVPRTEKALVDPAASVRARARRILDEKG